MARLTVQVKLLPDAGQSAALRATVERANAAANAASAVAWRTQTFREFDLHKLVYRDTRERFGLSAQCVVRLITKVADAYKLDTLRVRSFRPLGAVAYDDRILAYGSERVSIWTLSGRQAIPFVCGERQRELLVHQHGESDLVYRDGE